MQFPAQVVAAGTILLSLAAPAEAALKLYVTNSRGADISVVDVASRTVTGTLKVGDHVHGACAPADGSRVFTTISSDKVLKVIDTASDQVVDVIALKGWSNQCAATPDGRYVAVPDWKEDQVEIIDVHSRSAVKLLGIPHPHNCYNAGNENEFVCSSVEMHALYRIDLKALTFSAEYSLDGEPRPFAVTRDGKRAFVQLTGYHGIEVASPSPAAAPRRVDLPPAPLSSCLLEAGPQTPSHGIALSPDESQLWVDSLADNIVYAYDANRLVLQAKVPVGECPAWIAISPDGKYVAVSASASDEVSLIDRGSARELARIKVGKAPKRLVFVDVK